MYLYGVVWNSITYYILVSSIISRCNGSFEKCPDHCLELRLGFRRFKLFVVNDKVCGPNGIIMVHNGFFVVQLCARLADNLRKLMRYVRSTRSKDGFTEWHPGGGAVRLTALCIRRLGFPTTTRLRRITRVVVFPLTFWV